MKVCIVGSGPAGFYTAKYLLARYAAAATTATRDTTSSQRPREVDVTLIDQYPTPYGLVRFGVAPDHPEVKVVANDFHQTMLKNPDQCHFVGNVELGRDVSYDELRDMFDVVVLSYGASYERMLEIPGEREIASGVESAREFVSWYNALPERDVGSSIDDHPSWNVAQMTEKYANLLRNARNVVIIGQGNVALDVARILAKPTKDLLEFDLPDYALHTLENCAKGIESIYVVGRRGPVQAACTTKELRELTKINGMKVYIDPQELELDDISQEELEREGRVRKRMLDLMQKSVTPAAQGEKTVQLCFFRNPKEFLADEQGQLRAVRVERTRLEKSADGSVLAVGTGVMEDIECELAFKSIGYKSVPVNGVPFNHRKGVVPNREGRVVAEGEPQTGVYVCGWLKRGPTGVILSNIVDAKETVESICQDIDTEKVETTKQGHKSGRMGLHRLLEERGVQFVDYDQYQEIDQHEVEEGKRKGKLREKLTSVGKMLHVAGNKQE